MTEQEDVTNIISKGINNGTNPMTVTLSTNGRVRSRWYICGPKILHYSVYERKYLKPICDIGKILRS